MESSCVGAMLELGLETRHPQLISIATLPPELQTEEEGRHEVDIEGFYALPFLSRLQTMVLAAAAGKPAFKTHVMHYGQRVAFREGSDQAVVVQNHKVYCIHLKEDGIYPVSTENRVHCLLVQPNTFKDIALGTDRGLTVKRFEEPYQMPLEVKEEHFGGGVIDCMAFHPSGQHCVTAGPNSAGFRVWDTVHGFSQCVSTGINRITALSYSPCGNFLAAVSDRSLVFIYYTMNWSYVVEGASHRGGEVLACVWSSPCPNRSVLMIAFSDKPCLELCDVLVHSGVLYSHRVALAGTKRYLATQTGQGETLSIRDLCWDSYGRRLAAVMDQPHDKAGCIALFMTHYTQEPEFMSYLTAIPDIQGTRLFASSAACYDRTEKAVRFVFIINGRVKHLTSPLKNWEMDAMRGSGYRLLAA